MIFVCMFFHNFWMTKPLNFFTARSFRHKIIIIFFDVCMLYCSIVSFRLMFWIFEFILICRISSTKNFCWAFWWFWMQMLIWLLFKCFFLTFSKNCVKNNSIFYIFVRWLSCSNTAFNELNWKNSFRKNILWFCCLSMLLKSRTRSFNSLMTFDWFFVRSRMMFFDR